MGRHLVRSREAVRRLLGKPGRRTGVQQRKGLETKGLPGGRFYYSGRNPHSDDPRQMLTISGIEMRSGAERRRKRGFRKKQ